MRRFWASASLGLLAFGCAGAPPDQREGAGCWVHAFARTEYRPPVTTYTGPTHERFFLEGAGSLRVGPGARLEGYGGPGYKEKTLVLAPNVDIPDLAAAGFHRRVDAFQIACVEPARSP